MKIRLNGEPYESATELTVAQLLNRLDIHDARVAVELNLDILPRDKYATTALNDGDQVEVVHFVGGG
jgi:sulfur carrier protein